MNIINNKLFGRIRVILAKVQIRHPHRKSAISKQCRGKKFGYIIYITSGENYDVLHKSFGYRILTFAKASKFYDICCANARAFEGKLVDNYILPLWAACNCNEAIYKRRSHIDIVKYFGNKDFFPTFHDFLLENNLIQIDETITD